MAEKIKKEDRAFLYMRQNSRGVVNVKFGPDKYDKDTERLNIVLALGTLSCFHYFSMLTKNEPVDVRMSQQENIKLTYHALLDEAFPDVFEEKKRILGLEELAIERMEAGDPHSEEFLKQVEETKEKIDKRSKERIKSTSVEEKEEEFLKKVEDELEKIYDAKEYLENNNNIFFNKTEPEEGEREAPTILFLLVEERIGELQKLHSSISKK